MIGDSRFAAKKPNASDVPDFLPERVFPGFQCYVEHMSNQMTSVTLGHEAFAKISAVEGVRLSSEAIARAGVFEQKELSPKDRRDAIVRAHTPKK